MPEAFSPPKRSLVRLKSVLLLAVFVGCLIAIGYGSPHVLALVVVAGASSLLQYLVRCESCHSSIYYRAGGGRTLIAGPSRSRFMYASRCPYCGLERF
jgi:hypothetical protein